MYIEDDRTKNRKELGLFKIGEVFEYDSKFFIKTEQKNETGSACVCVNLDEGTHMEIGTNVLALPVEATLYIED